MVCTLLEQVMNVTKSTLPFVVSARDRALSFTEDMGSAVVFYFAESGRKKGEGIILKKPAEELAFISKLYYPIWCAPRNGKTLLFDGLGVSRGSLRYDVLPDVKAFVADIDGCAGKRQAYEAALSDHAHFFESATASEEKATVGLISSKDFTEDFENYLKELEGTQLSRTVSRVCLLPVVDEASISSGLSDLAELEVALDCDIKNLAEAMKLISVLTREHTDAIRGEMKDVQSKMNQKISVAKSVASEKVRRIKERYDALVLKASSRFEKQLQVLHQKRVALEKNQDRAVSQVERCQTEISTFRNRRDSRGEKRWKEEKDEWKREFAALKKGIEDLDKRIGDVESEKAIEISNVRAEFNAQSNEAMAGVRELEAVRDSKVRLCSQETNSLNDLTSCILSQMDSLSKQKRGALLELAGMGMQQPRRKLALVYVPFYLSCYQSGPQRRYAVFPPSIVGSMKAITKFKGMLGISKVRSLFQSRSRAMSDFLAQIVPLIGQNPVFEKEVHDIGSNGNILRSTETRERIKHGLAGLRDENWLSLNETDDLCSLL